MQVICASIDKCRFVEITLFANKSGQRKTEQTSEMKDMDTILLRVVVDDVDSPFNRCSNGCQSMNNNTTFNMLTCPYLQYHLAAATKTV
ncbi:hypothetical protein T09_8556 [Trichinella sp. T9]|uniref:Uncharacterized protein n=1 Tax=Trichinella murrelli TaxID=144512 RepID=A0A0V0TK48_9BILA|nr:hypothetical protein T05_14440 [Trichinella murrelli]KRX58212.1 hypothetical protein T09_8556 [Trichinella sp. T9]